MTQTLVTPARWLTGQLTIELIGCGGTGSSMLDELFRMHSLLTRLDHPGFQVRVWDGDEVSEANVGRQRFWPADVGWNKASLLVERYNSFGGTTWVAESRHLSRDDCKKLRPDLLISCVDDPQTRAMLGTVGAKLAVAKECLWIDTGNDHHSGQVILGHWAGRKRVKNGVPNVLDLYPTLRSQRADQRPSCSTEEALQRQDFGINQRVAAEGSGLIWQLLRHGALNRHGSFIYQREGEVLSLPISEAHWQTFEAA